MPPVYLRNLVTCYQPSPCLHYSNDRKLVTIQAKKRVGSRAFGVAAPSAWNVLPADLHTKPSIVSFKKVDTGKFVDGIRVYVRGGGGGQGLPKYGGVGGKGGDVYVVAKEQVNLKQIYSKHPTKRFIARSGGNSSKRTLLGKPGADVEITVPPGISIQNDMGRDIGEVNKAGESVLVARGGEGGHPANGYTGCQGERRNIKLDLRLIADIGLVGFPNAGKSTLLQAMSRASPKIADYPFTTIRPNIAVMHYPDFRQISLADLPGLIEGAHINVGMGHSFLKHVERTKMLLFVIDVNGFKLGVKYPHRTAFETVMLLNKEVELYKKDLLSKPAVLAINKIDSIDGEEKAEEVIGQLKHAQEMMSSLNSDIRPSQLVTFDDIISISAKEKMNTEHLQLRMRQLLDYYADIEYDKQHEAERTVQVSQQPSHFLS